MPFEYFNISLGNFDKQQNIEIPNNMTWFHIHGFYISALIFLPTSVVKCDADGFFSCGVSKLYASPK